MPRAKQPEKQIQKQAVAEPIIDPFLPVEEPKTVCERCVHCEVDDVAFMIMRYCRIAVHTIDPVTGFRHTYRCSEVNTKGDCRMFEPKPTTIWRRIFRNVKEVW